MRKWTVGDVMTQHVVAVSQDTPYLAILEQLAAHGVSAVPVVDDEQRVVGVVSEADLLHKMAFAGEDSERPLWEKPSRRAARARSHADTAGQLMSSPAITIRANAGVAEAARLMHRHMVKRLPVVDAEQGLIGIVSRADILGVYLRSDELIREDIVDGLVRRTLHLDPVSVQVDVIDGVVVLRGRVEKRSIATLLSRLAAIIPGVVEVREELVWEQDDEIDIDVTVSYHR